MLEQSYIKTLVSDLVLCVWWSVKMLYKKNAEENFHDIQPLHVLC